MSEDFGSYRLVERIGGGGLGEVFRAEGPAGQIVALKRLAIAHLDNQELAAALIREGEVAETMQHERLLGALERGHVGPWPYLTQPLASQGALLERLGPALPPDQLAQFARDLCDGLAAVHQRGFVHSDLSPGNLLFEQGRALLADFGAASEIGTAQSQPRGTYAFMSPEQVKGESLDERSDLFAAATLLWLCVSGQSIFSRPAQHLCFMAVVQDEPPALPLKMRAIEDALRPALAKKADERLCDIATLRETFIAALDV